MKLYIRRKALATDNNIFYIADEEGNKKYDMKFEVVLNKRIHLFDESGNKVALIKQELKSLMPKYSVYCGDNKILEIKKKFHLFLPKYIIDGLGWEIGNKLMVHDYEIIKDGKTIVSVEEKGSKWGQNYEITIANPQDELAAVAAVLAIDGGIEGGFFPEENK